MHSGDPERDEVEKESRQADATSMRTSIRLWLRRILDAKHWTPHRLAKEAGLGPATVHRALHDARFMPSLSTIEKIALASGMSLPRGLGSSASGPAPGFGEPEAVPMAESTKASPPSLDPDRSVWRLVTRAVELAGYLPGDSVVVDQSVTPVAGDLVCAQVYDLGGDSAETVFRIYHPPYLVSHSLDRDVSRKPLVVDNERVRIAGTVISMARVRGGA